MHSDLAPTMWTPTKTVSSTLIVVVGDIIKRFEQKGFLLKALKLTYPTREILEEHYRDLKAKPFFPKLMS